MRNPLNSIAAQNLEKKYLYEELSQELKKMETKENNGVQKCQEIIQKLKSGMKIQESSSNFLTYIVQDMLDFAQIGSGNFRKNSNEFDIVSAVEEVLIIQQRKALDNNIRLYATFINIESSQENCISEIEYK